MSLIGDLINVLTPEEAEKLKSLDVTGKERELLLLLLDSRHKPEPTNECLIRDIKTTPSNCDKLKSHLLQKSFKLLVPAGGAELLLFLAKKNYVNHLFYRELRRVEKEVDEHKPISERRDFYRSMFLNAAGVMFKDYNDAITRRLGDKLIKNSDSIDDRIYVEAKLLWVELNRSGITAAINKQATRDDIKSKIDAFAKEMLPTGVAEATYQVNYLRQWYYTLTEQMEDAYNCCKANYDLVTAPDSKFPSNYLLNTEFKYAEMLYFTDRFKQAHKQYLSLFYQKHPERLNTEIYHIAKFVQICIITENFDDAKKALKHYAGLARPSLDSSNVITLLHFAKLYMANNELEEGYNYVLKARSIISKNVYVQYEIELRNLENYYFYMKGDRKFAVALAKKNIKFLNSKEFTFSNMDFGYFYHLIIAFYHLQEKGKQLTREQKRMFEHYQHASYAQYGYLLKKMLNNCNVKLKSEETIA